MAEWFFFADVPMSPMGLAGLVCVGFWIGFFSRRFWRS